MNWKNLPIWIKSSILFVIIYIVYSLLSLLIPKGLIESNFLIENLVFIPQFFGIYSAILTGQITFASDGKMPWLFVIIVNVIIYFLIGAIVGYIYSKIKNKK